MDYEIINYDVLYNKDALVVRACHQRKCPSLGVNIISVVTICGIVLCIGDEFREVFLQTTLFTINSIRQDRL